MKIFVARHNLRQFVSTTSSRTGAEKNSTAEIIKKNRFFSAVSMKPDYKGLPNIPRHIHIRNPDGKKRSTRGFLCDAGAMHSRCCSPRRRTRSLWHARSTCPRRWYVRPPPTCAAARSFHRAVAGARPPRRASPQTSARRRAASARRRTRRAAHLAGGTA